jgi:hypothetical protein
MDPLRLRQSRVQDRARPEDLWQPLYDRVNFPAAGAQTMSFFATPRGGVATLIRAGVTSSVNKTTRDTNLDTAGQIPAKGYQVRGLSMVLIPAAFTLQNANTDAIVKNMQDILFSGYMEWKVGDKTVIQLPLHMIPAYSSIQGVASTTANNVSAYGIQNRSDRGMYILGVPVALQPFDTFTVTFTFDGGPTSVAQSFDIQFLFNGVVRRPT